MATYVILRTQHDGGPYGLVGEGSTWSQARGLAPGLASGQALSQMTVGVNNASGMWNIWEGFLRFNTTVLDEDAVVTSAVLRLLRISLSTNTPWEMRAYPYPGTNWGSANPDRVDPDTWVTPSSLSGHIGQVTVPSVTVPTQFFVRLDTDAVSNDELLLVFAASQVESASTPSFSDRLIGFDLSTPGGDTGKLPRLVVHTVEPSSLAGVHDAAVQLSDASTVYLERDLSTSALLLRRVTSGETVTTLATLPTSGGSSGFVLDDLGLQAFTVTVDDQDNLYVFGPADDGGNNVGISVFLKSGASWSALAWRSTNRVAALGRPTAIAATWCAAGASLGNKGYVMVVAFGRGATYSMAWLAFADQLLAGSSLSGATWSNPSWLVPSSIYSNMSGRGLSIETDVFGGTRFGVFSWSNDALVSTSATVTYATRMARFTISSGTPTDVSTDIGLTAFDALGGVRGKVVAYGVDQFVGVWNTGDGVRLKRIGISGTQTISGVTYFDAVAAGEAIWVYYLDGMALKKRPYFPATNNLGAVVDVTTLATVTARSHLRTVKRLREVTFIEVHNAYEDGGNLLVERYQDFFNLPPDAPALDLLPGFDANVNQTFSWSFSDPNPGDSQTAYQLQIQRVSDDVDVVDTGKVVSTNEFHEVAGSTLANATEYRWRVRVWDALDEMGAYSSYETFEPTLGPVVTIDFPADLVDIDVADINVQWTQTAGGTQDSYRVRAIDNDTEAVIQDSGWVSSVATSHLLEELPGDDRNIRIEVTLRSGGVEGNTESVVVNVEFVTVDPPTITLSAHEFYIEVTIVNPPPTGDRPDPTNNRVFRRKTGETSWTRIAVNVGVNEAYRDYAVASGQSYDYFVQARSD